MHTLENSLLPYIPANMQNPPTQHGYKTQHSTVTALHTLNNTVAKGFNQISPYANNYLSTRYEQNFQYNKRTYTNQKAATDQNSRYNHKVHRTIHQGAQTYIIHASIEQSHTKYRQTTCTLYTPDPAGYENNLDHKISNITLPMATHLKVLGLTLDPNLTYSTHIHNISVHAHTPQRDGVNRRTHSWLPTRQS